MKDAPLWSRVSRPIWRSTDFRNMGDFPPSAPGLWLFLITGEHKKSVPGLFVLGVGAMADDLRWSPAMVKKHLATLIAKGHVEVDPVTNVMWLPKALDHNPPENPNVVAGWKRDWQSIPDCALKTKAKEALRAGLAAIPPKKTKEGEKPESPTRYADAFAIALSERPPNPSPNPSGKGPPNIPPNDPPADQGNTAPNRGGNVTPNPRADVPPNVDLIEEREETKRKETASPARTPERPPAPARAHEATPGPDAATALESTDEDPILDEFEVIRCLVEAPGSRFDQFAGSAPAKEDFHQRLRGYRLPRSVAKVMGALLADPAEVWPWADRLDHDSAIDVWWLLGSTDGGSRSGKPLSDLVAKAKAIVAEQRRAAAKRAESERKRVEAQNAPPPAPRKAAATPEEVAAKRPAFARVLPPVAPAPTEVTHG